MKDIYLNELKSLLYLNNIPNVDEIISIYNGYFDLGFEAGLSYNEIVEKLGTPKEVLIKYTVKKEESSTNEEEDPQEDFKDNIKISLKASIPNDSIIIEHKNTKDVEVILEGIDNDDYIITKSKTAITINHKSIRKIKRNSGKIRITLPNNYIFSKLDISIASGDVIFDKIISDKTKIQIASGNIEGHDLDSKDISIKSASGNLKIDNIICDSLSYDLVSGDAKISTFKGNKLNLNTITGEIDILNGECEHKKVTTVSGKIYINGEKISKNINDILRGLF